MAGAASNFSGDPHWSCSPEQWRFMCATTGDRGSMALFRLNHLLTDRGGGRTHLFSCLSSLTIDHASLSGRSTVPTPNRDTPNTQAIITLFSMYSGIT